MEYITDNLGNRRHHPIVRLAAAAMVAALEASWLLPLARRIVTRIFSRLSFMPYLAGGDVRGFAARLLGEVARKRARRELSRRYLRGWVAALLEQSLRGPGRRRTIKGRCGAEPPAFAIVSPNAGCNLRCAHCYAATGIIPRRTLSFGQVDRVASSLEAAGTGLFILSGGEPLTWRNSQGHRLFELAAKHPGLLFIVYTNGTLLDDHVARRLADSGNVLPLLSLEGLREETDEVRGTGVYESVHRAMGRLRRAGVLFGVSVTASPRNAKTLGSQAFFRETVDRAGASFIWVLDLAPLGRAEQAEVLTAAARDELQTALNRESGRGRLVVGFLHTRLSPTGCFGAGRFDGFFYLDWEGSVRRCVYQPEVLIDAHAGLGSLEDADRVVAESARLAPCPLERGAVPPGEGSR